MAAGAYAALMSLMHTLEVILHPSQQRLHINRIQIRSLLRKVCSLQEFLEKYSPRDHKEMAALESRIVDTAREADDVIDYHVLDQIVARSTGNEAQSSTSFSEYIQTLIKKMEDLIETDMMRIKETTGALEEARLFIDFSPVVSSRLAPKDQNTLVGSDKKLIDIMETLTEQQSNRQIIAIVGMGGIGKTSLAKNVYKHPLIVNHFDIRAWAIVSQNYNARKIILEILSQIERSKEEGVVSDDQLDVQLYKSKQESVLSDAQLGQQLYKILFGRRYLIVMDDLWSIEAWDEIHACFPNNDNRNGSQIMITTRDLNVARQLNSFMSFEMELLDVDQSWMLLCDKVFGKEGCPPELEELGKGIAKKCRGLPLAIVVIGGLLAKSNKTREVWEYATENLNSIINSGDDENWLKILYLSYRNLPVHLKPCFLYLAVNSKYHEVAIVDPSWLLVGEGFVKPKGDKSMEEVANEYITELVDRNLIFVHETGILGRVKSWGMHDLLRKLCERQALEENFFFALHERGRKILHVAAEIFHVATEKFKPSGTQVLDLRREASLMRSTARVFASRLIIWMVSESIMRLPFLQECSLNSRNLNSMGSFILQLPYKRECALNSLNSNSMGSLIPSISRFWCLQSLIVINDSNKLIILPSEIWDLPQLRHLFFHFVSLRDPHNDEHNPHILENLQTLSGVVGFRCTNEVLKRAPNLKTLGVVYFSLLPPVLWPYFCLHNLVHLHKLESLYFRSIGTVSLNYLRFPVSLKELTLIGCHLPWEDMTIVGSSPNLEALWLEGCTFQGQTWCPVHGEFDRLRRLGIGETDLLHWKADKTHFPILEHLLLRSLNLEEFPEDFGELPTLGKIQVFSCGDSTNAWAEQIRKEQESFGNEDLQVIIKRKREDVLIYALQHDHALLQGDEVVCQYRALLHSVTSPF